MTSFSLVIPEVLKALWNVVFGPPYIFWVVVAIVAWQFKRINRTREQFFGLRGESILKQTVQATLHGILGGFLGSLLMVFTGISLERIAAGTLLLLSLLLMMVSPHLICFSYSGGILALVSYFLNIAGVDFLGLANIDIPLLMALVAILHLVESGLILIGGHLGAVPVFIRDVSGRVIGGFTLQKFWPIPIASVAFTLMPQIVVEKPAWWPLLIPELSALKTLGFALLPVVAMLGYGDLALARTPVEKSRLSARNLAIFSLTLFLLAFLASRYPVLGILPALFSPIGHELVIYLGQRSEIFAKPLYVPPERGVKILEVLPNSPAQRLELSTGDVILAVNGRMIYSRADLEESLWYHPGYIEVEYLQYTTGKFRRSAIPLAYGEKMGIIPVPEGYEPYYTELRLSSLVKNLWGKILRQD